MQLMRLRLAFPVVCDVTCQNRANDKDAVAVKCGVEVRVGKFRRLAFLEHAQVLERHVLLNTTEKSSASRCALLLFQQRVVAGEKIMLRGTHLHDAAVGVHKWCRFSRTCCCCCCCCCC